MIGTVYGLAYKHQTKLKVTGSKRNYLEMEVIMTIKSLISDGTSFFERCDVKVTDNDRLKFTRRCKINYGR
jgi:hypothetical protein